MTEQGRRAISFGDNVVVRSTSETIASGHAGLREQLLDFVDHGAGTEIRINGVAKKWTRDAKGEWIEEATSESKPRK